MLDRKEWILAFLVQPGGPYPVDQIRVMKGMFLWSQEGPEEARRLFRFEPYDFGPFDTRIYQDLETLEKTGLISVDVVRGTRQRRYGLTTRGEQQAGAVLRSLSAETVEQLAKTKVLVTTLGFEALLQHVYAAYPAFAVRSVARL
jgi:DNA-binding PadR family transcriptional regulator